MDFVFEQGNFEISRFLVFSFNVKVYKLIFLTKFRWIPLVNKNRAGYGQLKELDTGEEVPWTPQSAVEMPFLTKTRTPSPHEC